MTEADLNVALKKLHEHIASNNKRNTPEREAVLRAAYSFPTRFTFEDIEQQLPKVYEFPVSKATIYNSLRLFISLDIMHCIRHNSRTYYDLVIAKSSCVQVCRVCGKVTTLDCKKAEKIVSTIKLRRFTREAFNLTFDGICTSCKIKITKAQNKMADNQKKKTKNNIQK